MQADIKSELYGIAPASVYHMTHIDNLEGIFSKGLLAHNNNFKKVDISNKNVNNYREKLEPIYNRSIHSYVPFYFNPRNAMLYSVQKRFSSSVVLLEFSNELLLKSNAVFTNGNASRRDTDFSNNIYFLNDFNWNLVFSTSWSGLGDHVKTAMMSEVLIYQHQGLESLIKFNCQSKSVARMLNNRFNTNLFVSNPSLFFSI